MQTAEIDLSIFLSAFFDEAMEHVADIEAALLELETSGGDRELLNRIFRGAHSIKGGSGTLGLSDLTRFTHALESLLDPLRDGSRHLDQALADLLFRSTDVLKGLLRAARTGEPIDPAGERVLEELRAAVSGPVARLARPSRAPVRAGLRTYRIAFAPHVEIFSQGMDPVLLLRNLYALGEVSELVLEEGALPELAALDPERCHLRWSLKLATVRAISELEDVFAFVEGESRVEIEELGLSVAQAPLGAARAPAVVVAAAPAPGDGPSPGGVAPVPGATPPERAVSMAPSTLRVSTDKLDRLVNLVGELVIAQSMITQSARDSSTVSIARMGEAAVEMERNTRELQELVMSLRMVPMASVFNRFPRLARDLALQCHKKIVLELEGQETEIDKGVIEQLADPLTHLIRNAIDHGLETPEERVAAGKAEIGTIHLSARHQGGSVIVEVRDDGRGLNVERIHQKALAAGLAKPGEKLSEEQIHALIFAPGFSTAASVTDLSGRGVGLDVVRRNIDALNGSFSLSSERGRGTHFRIRLPLTLAILEGLSLRVGTQVFVLPLLSIAESFRPTKEQLKAVMGKGEIVLVRGEPIPLVRLYEVLSIAPEATDPLHALVVVVETGSTKIGLLVDELLGQAQVVVKSLEAHYRKVDGVMGATILGDGRVALILDVEGLGRGALAPMRGISGAGGHVPRDPSRPQSPLT